MGPWPGGTWESVLTCQEFTAVRGVGFEPVGVAGQARWWSGNVEVAGWSELVNQCLG